MNELQVARVVGFYDGESGETAWWIVLVKMNTNTAWPQVGEGESDWVVRC